MGDLNGPEVDVEQLMQRVRIEVERRRSNLQALPETAVMLPQTILADGVASSSLTRPHKPSQDPAAPTPPQLTLADQDEIALPTPSQPTADGRCRLKDLVGNHDREFIHAAYWAVLQRAPDEGGHDVYLRLLRSGTPKVEILRFLRDSPEGRTAAVPITGLWFHLLILKISRSPIVGSIVRFVTALRNLAETQHAQHVLVSRIISLVEQAQARSRETLLVTNRALRDLEDSSQQLTAYAASKPGNEALNRIEASIRVLNDAIRVHGELANETAYAQRKELEHIKTKLSDASMTLKALQSSKADQSSLEEARYLLIRALETKAARHELTALTNHLLGLLQARLTKEDIAPLEQAHDAVIKQTRADCTALEATNREFRAALEAARTDSRVSLESALRDVNQTTNSLAQAKVDHAALDNVENKITASVVAALEVTHGELTAALEAARTDARVKLDETRTCVNQSLESLARSKVDQSMLANFQTEVKATFEASIGALTQTVTTLSQSKADYTAFNATNDDLKASLQIVRREARETLQGALAPINAQTRDLKRNLLDQERRVGLLFEEATKRLSEPNSANQFQTVLAEEAHLLDAMYASFEDIFRGTRANIRDRQTVYLPYIREAKAGDPSSPVVDLGCGRGEWLELLRDSDLHAQGVDVNRTLLERCRDLGLNVVESDAITFLRAVKANSLGAVTSFHVIEHLPHKTLIALLDAAFQALRPGGIAIFETPNPRNVQVGSCNFYMDPTHRHPLPPDLMRYILDARGFVEIAIKELHPYGPENLVVDGPPMVNDTLNRFFFCAQDYAVIGRKP